MNDAPPAPEHLRIALVTGLSGGGKASILRALEDIGYEAVDNPPLTMIEEMVARSERPLAVGVDARTRGFDAELVLAALQRLRGNPALRPELVFAWADEATLLRRYTETRRRHPLAPQGRVTDGIAAEEALTALLREHADLVIDTSALPLPDLRQKIERYFGSRGDAAAGRWWSRWSPSLIRTACRGKQIWYSTPAFCGTRIMIPYCNPERAWIRRSARTSPPTRTTSDFSPGWRN